jgi:hypothetical protein
LVTDPAEAGAVAVIVKSAAPLAADAARPDDSVTLQLSSAPAADGSEPQFTVETPVPAVTAVATTPAGS